MTPAQFTRIDHFRTSLLRYVIAAPSIALLLMGAFWIMSGVHKFESDITMMHDQFLETNKSIVADQTRQAAATIQNLRVKTEQVLKTTLREHVYRAHAIATSLWTNNPDLPPKEVARHIRDALRPIRFNGNRGYIFIFDEQGVNRLHPPAPGHEGTRLWGWRDGTGKFVVQDIRAMCDRDGEGFYQYQWPKPDAPDAEFPKIAFVKRFDPLGWYIGTGEYVEDATRDMQAEALARVESISFGKGGYVFASNWNGISLTAPGKGRDNSQITDMHGVKIVQELIATARKGGGFVAYVMPPVDGMQPYAKISHVVPIPEWQWYVGAGFSLENLEKDIAARREQMRRVVVQRSLSVCLLIVILLAASVAYSHFIVNKLDAGIAAFSSFFVEAASSNVRLRSDQVAYAEFTPMAEAANRMLDDRDAAQEALAASEHYARVLFDNAYQIAAVLDTDGVLQDMNIAAREASGAGRDDIRNLLFWDTPWWGATPEEKELLRQAVSTASQGKSTRIEVRQRSTDSSLRVVDFSFKPIFDEHHGVSLLIAEGRDITESRNAAAALEEREARLDAIFRSAPVGIGLVSGKSLVRANDRLCAITGYDMEELISLPPHALHDAPADYTTMSARIEDQLAAHGMGSTETIWRQKSGNIVEVLLNKTAISWPGNAGWAVVTVMDITRSKHAERELRRLQSLLQDIVNSMPSMLATVDTTGCVLQWNLEAERLSGVTTADAVGRPLALVFPALAAKLDLDATVKSAMPRTVHRVSWEIPHTQRYADITVYPLDEVGGAVIRVDDATERVRLEETMVRVEKMLSLGGLAAGMAHEINNPLAGMMQGAQVMATRISPDLKKNRDAAEQCGTTIEAIAAYAAERGIDRILAGITDSGRRASRIIANMLRFSHKNESKMAPCNVAALLDNALELAANDYDLKKHYDFRKIEIVRQYSPDLPPAPCDSGEIQQVFLNILKNGAQAMADAHHKALAENREAPTPQFSLHARLDNGMVRVDIVDNGPGMPDHVRKRIFEPFFTTKPVGQGTGLGLSVSYCIITENHGGVITVDSTPGKGSTFSILLPVRGAKA